jgi:murein DD-endopeptidase MepM/ murein hydrolase activator NlpD
MKGAAAGLAALLSSFAFVPRAVAADPREAWAGRWIDTWVAESHADPALFDKPKLVREALAGGRLDEPRDALADRLRTLVLSAYYAFAPLDARHDDRERYRLPFGLEVPRYLVQGVNGPYTHQGQHAFDFAMPVGTDVLAARAGVVARIRDGFTEGGLDARLAGRSNAVFVLHDDGTFAEYSHLRPGILPREGKRVAQGERLAASGHTGLSAGPHLHFAVSRRSSPTAVATVPIRFGVGNPAGFVPKEGEFYGGRSKLNVTLRVTAGSQPLDESNPLRLAPSASASLSVGLVEPGGETSDVTKSAATSFLAPTLWSVRVDARGVVTASPSPDFAAAFAKLPAQYQSSQRGGWGIVLVTHEDEARGRFGFASVPVLIGDAAR